MEAIYSKKKKIKYETSNKPLPNHLVVRNKILKNAEEKMGIHSLLNNKANLNYEINKHENTNFNFHNNFETSMPNLNNLHNFNSFYTKNSNINSHTLYSNSFSSNKNKMISNKANLEKYYKNLYLKAKNENSMLLKERIQLINKNKINEQTIIDLIKDKRELKKINENLEKTIEEYKKIINEKDIKKEAEKNYTINNTKLVKDNESLYNKINKLIQENIELKCKLKEMNSTKIINNKPAIQQYNSFNSKVVNKISESNINDNKITNLRNNSSNNNKQKDVLEIKPNLNKINIKMRNAKKLIQANRTNSTNNANNTNTNKALSREHNKKRAKINSNIGIDVNIDNLFYSQIIQTDKNEKNNLGDNYYKNGEIYDINGNKNIDYEKKYNEINYEYNKLIKEISNIKKSISIINNKNKNFQIKINELQEINNNLKKINSKQKEEIENLNKKYNIKNEINNYKDEPNEKYLDLPRQMNNLNEVKEYNLKNNNYLDNKDKINVNNLNKLDINEKNKTTINASQYNELKLNNDKLSKKVSELTKNIIEKDKKINSLEILEEKYKEDNRKLNLDQNELKNFKNKNNSGKSLEGKKDLELKIQEMKKNNDSLKNKISNILKENKKLKENGDKLIKENNELLKIKKTYTNNKNGNGKENNEEINKKQIELLNEEIKNLKKFQTKYIDTEHENVLLKQKNNEIIKKYELLKNKIEDENKNKSSRNNSTKLEICSNIDFKLTNIKKENNFNNNFEDLLCRPSLDINQQKLFNDNVSKLLSKMKPMKEVEINIIQGKNDGSGKKIRKRKVKIIEPFEMKDNQENKEDKKEEKENKDMELLLNDTNDKIKDKYFKLKNNYNILRAENKNLIKENEKLSEKNNILELMINNEEDFSSKSDKNVYRIKNKIDNNNYNYNKNEIENSDNINNISSLKEINQKLMSEVETLQKEKLRFEEKLLNLQQLLNSELEKEKNVITKLRQSQDLSPVRRTSNLIDNIPEQEKEKNLINDNENSQNLFKENKCLKEVITQLKLEISEFKKEQNYIENKDNIINNINCDNDSCKKLINELKKENEKLKKENFIYFKEIQSLNNYIMRLEKNMGIDNEINNLKLMNIEQNKLIMNLSQQIKEYQSKVDNIIIGKSNEEKEEQIKILINEVKGVRKRFLSIITFEGRIKEMDELIDILNEIKGEIKESKNSKIKGLYEKLNELINKYQMNNDKFYNDIILQRLKLKDNYENVNISKI